jgi:Fe-Mn family superoxide dismutase
VIVELPELPFAQDALAPHLSARTLAFHHGKHHAGYVRELNAAIRGTRYADLDLPEIVRRARRRGDRAVFNNAAQAWNHAFFWSSLAPHGGGRPGGRLASAIDRAFGSFEAFRDSFVAAGTGCFGSGWVWLVGGGGCLRVVSTPNADLPRLERMNPILTCDVWEHAYYLDYRHERKRFLEAFVDHLANWDHAGRCLAAAEALDAGAKPVDGPDGRTPARR